MTALIFLSAVVLEASFLPFLGVSPDVVLILALLLVVFKGFDRMWPAVVLAGIFLDFFSGFAFGLISFSFLLAVYLTELINQHFFSLVKLWIIMILAALGTFLYKLLLILFAEIFRLDLSISIGNFFIGLLAQIGYNLALTLILLLFFYGFKKVFRRPSF